MPRTATDGTDEAPPVPEPAPKRSAARCVVRWDGVTPCGTVLSSYNPSLDPICQPCHGRIGREYLMKGRKPPRSLFGAPLKERKRKDMEPAPEDFLAKPKPDPLDPSTW